MAQDISGFGARVILFASITFPAGLTVSAFADDTDPFDIPSQQIADKAMGVNGDLVTWGKANPLMLSLGLIPGSDDDENMQVLVDSNRPGRGRLLGRDVITCVVAYPSGKTITYTQGAITDGQVSNGLASAGRLKTSVYQFAFEDVTRAG